MYEQSFDTPLGPLRVRADDAGITAVTFAEPTGHNPNALTQAGVTQLAEYFDGTRREFTLPLAPAGTTFQQAVWSQLNQIPFGQTCSYGDIANRLANPKAVRAVGAANGRNPIAVIVPCHRVIGANGTLTGYAGGLDRKSWLLNHEGVTLKPTTKTNPVEEAQGLLFQ
ncbi:methylated-DNA--[protein]-cysteine S-methyltransferase [Acanthopleuribacter pedis]|uniref:Methylated-DNA--protein-cysteine methyltransferase n=1 Tax=Acanthopleuribacter pedis TaxID=442870 RepID=A0A8J7U696_9BACT|nr:methylated-DNA--[protein]-cysteine S-methyltransferase [Acanthopleuribacter pedis]MBO1321689.1 methylated-DNA--[protein]-cysteine S-methyltransferase [Acanthopleuribacter pedis]